MTPERQRWWDSLPKEECEAAIPELRKKYLGGDKNG